MSANPSTFISNLKSAMTFSNLSEVLNGFGRSIAVNNFYDYAHAMDQGASPKTASTAIGKMQISIVSGTNVASLIHAMSWTRTSWLVTPFMLMIPLTCLAQRC